MNVENMVNFRRKSNFSRDCAIYMTMSPVWGENEVVIIDDISARVIELGLLQVDHVSEIPGDGIYVYWKNGKVELVALPIEG